MAHFCQRFSLDRIWYSSHLQNIVSLYNDSIQILYSTFIYYLSNSLGAVVCAFQVLCFLSYAKWCSACGKSTNCVWVTLQWLMLMTMKVKCYIYFGLQLSLHINYLLIQINVTLTQRTTGNVTEEGHMEEKADLLFKIMSILI